MIDDWENIIYLNKNYKDKLHYKIMWSRSHVHLSHSE